MTAGQKMFESKMKMDEVFSDAAVVQTKIDAEDNHLALKTIGVLLAMGGMVASLTFAMDGGPAAGYWLALGAVLMIVVAGVFGKVVTAPLKYSQTEREFRSRFDAAQSEYLRVLEEEAEAHGIDPGTVKSRERKGEENTAFTATRNNLPVSLTVEEQGGEMVIKVNGEPLREKQNA